MEGSAEKSIVLHQLQRLPTRTDKCDEVRSSILHNRRVVGEAIIEQQIDKTGQYINSSDRLPRSPVNRW